eukprot:1892485-Prymnesium_polylepis.1
MLVISLSDAISKLFRMLTGSAHRMVEQPLPLAGGGHTCGMPGLPPAAPAAPALPPLPTILIDNDAINNHSPYVYIPSRLNEELWGAMGSFGNPAERAPLSPVVESPAGLQRELGETIMMMTEANVAEVAAGRIGERVVAAARENT